MTIQIKTLSDSEIRTINTLVEHERKHIQNPRKPLAPDLPNQSPEVYLAKIPSGGVAAAISMGTGSPATPSIILPSECDIYRLVREAGTGAGDEDHEIIPVEGLSKLVFNAAPFRISSGFSPIVRDKFGHWFFTGPYELKGYGKTTADLTYGQRGTVNVWRNEAVTSPLETEIVYFTWLGVSGQVIPSGTKIEYTWWADLDDGDGAWRVSNSNCEAS